MKRTIFILILTIISNSLFCQIVRMSGTTLEEIENSEQRKSLGILKITTKEFCDSLSYNADINYKIQSVKEFNKNGDLIRVYSSKKDSSIYLSGEYQYDDQHRRLTCQQYYESGKKGGTYNAIIKDSLIVGEKRNPSVMSIDSSYFSFYSNGERVLDITYKNGAVKDSTFYTIENGKRVLAKKFYKGKLEYFIRYEYLTDEDYIERIFEKDTTLRLKRYWKYDSKSNLLDRVEYNKNEEITTWYSNVYNDEGLEIEGGVFKTAEKILSFRIEKIYKNSNLIMVSHFNEENELTSKSEYYYDSNGLNTAWKSISYKKDKPKVSFIYKYEYEYQKE